MKKSIIKKAVSLALGISMLATGFCLPNSNVNKTTTVSAACMHQCRWYESYSPWTFTGYTTKRIVYSSPNVTVETVTKNYIRTKSFKCVNCNKILKTSFEMKSIVV